MSTINMELSKVDIKLLVVKTKSITLSIPKKLYVKIETKHIPTKKNTLVLCFYAN